MLQPAAEVRRSGYSVCRLLIARRLSKPRCDRVPDRARHPWAAQHVAVGDRQCCRWRYQESLGTGAARPDAGNSQGVVQRMTEWGTRPGDRKLYSGLLAMV